MPGPGTPLTIPAIGSAWTTPSAGKIQSWGIHIVDVRMGNCPTASMDNSSNSGHIVLRCWWGNRFDVAIWLLGATVQTGNSSTNYAISRLLPQRFPAIDQQTVNGQTWAATKIVDMRGYKPQQLDPLIQWGDNSGVENPPTPLTFINFANYEMAELTVLFEQVPYTMLPDGVPEITRFVENPAGDPEPSGQYLGLPGNQFTYQAPSSGSPLSPSNLIGQSIIGKLPKIVPQMAFKVAWRRLPFYDVWKVDSPWFKGIFGDGTSVPYFGAINRDKFLDYSPGTLLLHNVRPYRKASPLSQIFIGAQWRPVYELDVLYDFLYSPFGWNFIFGVYPPPGSIPPPVIGAYNGWYYVSGNNIYVPPGSVVDFKSLYNERPFSNLFQLTTFST
jgi:hypothetical protein